MPLSGLLVVGGQLCSFLDTIFRNGSPWPFSWGWERDVTSVSPLKHLFCVNSWHLPQSIKKFSPVQPRHPAASIVCSLWLWRFKNNFKNGFRLHKSWFVTVVRHVFIGCFKLGLWTKPKDVKLIRVSYDCLYSS